MSSILGALGACSIAPPVYKASPSSPKNLHINECLVLSRVCKIVPGNQPDFPSRHRSEPKNQINPAHTMPSISECARSRVT